MAMIKDDRAIKHIFSTPQNWHIEFFIYCDGYIESRELIAKDQRVRLNDLTDFVAEMRADALAAVNDKHIVDEGWKARLIG